MRKRTEKLLLGAFVAATGLQIGGGLYETRVVVPRWTKHARPEDVARALEESGHVSAGRRFWPFVSPPASILTVANLVAAWRSGKGVKRRWWLGAVVTNALSVGATYAYFVPTLARIGRAEEHLEREVEEMASRWARLNLLRMFIGACAWLAGLVALSLMEKESP